MTRPEKAVQIFNDGYSCSQAVLAAYADDYGLDLDMALKISGPFGGGIGSSGDICGALSGAAMVLGLEYRGTEAGPTEAKKQTMSLVRQMLADFREKHGCIDCVDILGIDISNAEGAQEAREKGLFETRCPECVKDASELLETLLPSK